VNDQELRQKVRLHATALMTERGHVAPVELVQRLGWLQKKDYEAWRQGKVAFLEKVIGTNLSKISMAMKALRQVAKDCGWRNSFTAYHGWGKTKGSLRFSRSGDAGVEKGWATHWLRGDKKAVPQEMERGSPRSDCGRNVRDEAKEESPLIDEDEAEAPTPEKWHSRGYLPHHDAPGRIQGITCRLHDSLPAPLLARLIEEIGPSRLVDPELNRRYRQRLEALSDAGHGCCLLRHPQIAVALIQVLKKDDGRKYDLIAWVIMPNHFHIVIRQRVFSLGYLVWLWKWALNRRVSRLAAQGLSPSLPEPFWQEEYHDRIIRDELHLLKAKEYVRDNPLKAGLVKRAEDWQWSSFFDGGHQS